MTDEITPQTQQTLPKKDDRKPQPSNGSAQQQGGNKQGPKKNGPAGRSTSISAGAGNPRPSSRSSNRSINKKGPNASNAQGAADSGSESANAKNSNSGEGRQRGKSQSGGQRGGHRKASQSTSQGNRQGGNNRQRQPSGSPAPPSNESSDALSSLQRVIADLKTTSPPTQSGNAQQQALAAGSNLPANAPIFQPGAAAFPGNNFEQPLRHRKAASLGASSLASNVGYSPNLGSMIEDVEDQGTPLVEEGEILDNAYQTGHQRRSLSQSFNPPRFQALAAQQQQDQSDNLGPSGRPQLAPNFLFGARRRPSSNLSMGPPINEEDVGFQFPQQSQNNSFDALDTGHRKQQDERGDFSGIMAEQVSSRYAPDLPHLNPDTCLQRSPFRTRSRLCSNNSRLSTSSSSLQIKFSPSRPPALRLAVAPIAVSIALSR